MSKTKDAEPGRAKIDSKNSPSAAAKQFTGTHFGSFLFEYFMESWNSTLLSQIDPASAKITATKRLSSPPNARCMSIAQRSMTF